VDAADDREHRKRDRELRLSRRSEPTVTTGALVTVPSWDPDRRLEDDVGTVRS
jgi:hypothetical protein